MTATKYSNSSESLLSDTGTQTTCGNSNGQLHLGVRKERHINLATTIKDIVQFRQKLFVKPQ